MTPLRILLTMIALGFSGALHTQALAQGDDTATAPPEPLGMGDADLSDYLWERRPLVVFADTDRDPAFIRQLELLEERAAALAERDVVVLTDTDPSSVSPLRKKLRPRGFMLVLIGKDGNVKLRKPFPWSVRELSRSIDKMPMRQQEIRDRQALSSELN